MPSPSSFVQPSQALRASSPKVGAIGKGVKSERNAFGSLAAAGPLFTTAFHKARASPADE